MRVLVVEDEDVLAGALATGLRRAKYAVDVAADGGEALEKLELATPDAYDVVVLDRDLPVVHGDEVCRRLRAAGRPERVLMLTASGGVDATVEGLSLGADDYLAKPFAFRELVARVDVLARREAPAAGRLTAGDVAVDLARREVWRAGRAVVLGTKEYGVLVELLRADGAWVSAEALLERVWDENADPFTAAVRIAVTRLRAKLGPPDPIETARGVGYRIALDRGAL
jgi:DNA-binding response OmpR family regulator